jgi:NAD(P)-dependent dehydrogenase (short-subunit alcohol dehydrogenase family)
VRSPDSIAGLSDAVRGRRGPTTVLVNSAGVTVTKPALDVTVEDWDRIQTVHLRGPFLTAQAFAPDMIAEGYGKIVNLSSTWAATVAPGRSVYLRRRQGRPQPPDRGARRRVGSTRHPGECRGADRDSHAVA